MNKEQALEFRKKCRATPGYFASEVLGSPKKYDYQQTGFEALLKGDRVAIKSAHDLGKTFTISDAILEALFIWGPVYIIVTAPTWNMVENVVFGEIRKKYKDAKYPLGGDLSLTKLKLAEKWMLLGFSPKVSKEGDASTFQGFHNKLVIVVFEEATGIDKQLYDAAEGMLTSANVKWWCIGNPTDPNSGFAKLFNKMEWTKITWDCFLSPNLIANKITNLKLLREEVALVRENPKRMDNYKVVAPELLTLKWVIAKYIDWGEGSPLFQSKVLAHFPDTAENTLIPISLIEKCMEEGEVDYKVSNTLCIGADIARFGNDKVSITGLLGNKELFHEIHSKQDTVFTYGRIKDLALQHAAKGHKVIIGLDDGGIGGGVTDQLKNDEALKGEFFDVVPINFGEKASNEERFYNKASEMYFLLAEDIKEDGLILIKDDILVSELSGRRYDYTNKGQFRIEPKDKFKERLGHSPDRADSKAIANYLRHEQAYGVAIDWDEKLNLDTFANLITPLGGRKQY